MTEWFEDILAKKETCVLCTKMNEQKKPGKFNILMAAADKKVKLEEKKIEIKAIASHDTNILFLKT